jgi:hypothetical protein
MATRKTCLWLAGKSNNTCGQPVAYTFRINDDGKRVRVYDNFCKSHTHNERRERQVLAEAASTNTSKFVPDPDDWIFK